MARKKADGQGAPGDAEGAPVSSVGATGASPGGAVVGPLGPGQRWSQARKREVVLRSIRYYRTIFDWDFVIAPADYDNGMKVWYPIAVEKPIPYARATDMGFVGKARAKFKS